MIKSESESRRVKITKKLIKDSLMELLETKTLSSISVTELCQVADVNRSTFYAYYDDLLSVIEEVEEELIKMIPSAEEPDKSISLEVQIANNLEQLFKYVRTYSRLFNVLLQTGDLNFKDRLVHEALVKFPLSVGSSEEELIGYVYAMNGVLGMIQYWINTDFSMDEKTLSKLAVKMSLGATD